MNVPRAVLDTNILVSAMLSPFGNPAKVYRLFLTGMLALVFSENVFAEYEDVLFRPRLHIDVNDAETVLAAIRRYGETVLPVPSTGAMIDENDRVFYDTAKNADAYLITGNTKHYPKEPFILTPAAFLELQL
jgi:putative PIN family toxin of toxin-antitoxin system